MLHLESGSDGDKKSDAKMTGGVVDCISHRNSIDEKEVDGDSPRNIEGYEAGNHMTDAVDADMKKISISGEHSNDPAADFVVDCQEESPPKEAEKTRRDKDPNESLAGKTHQKRLMTTSYSSDYSLEESVKPMLSSRSAEHGHIGLTDGAEKYNECNDFSIFDFCGQQYLGNIKSSSMEKEVEITSAVRSVYQIALENEAQANHINNQLVVRSRSAENLKNENQHKGKEKIKYDNEECNSLSNERKDSSESVESSNSQSKIAKGKRGLDFNSSTFLGSKKIKLDSSEGSCSRALVRRNSSFLNWMSIITSSNLIPSELHQHSPENITENFICIGMEDKTEGCERPLLGFTNIVQSQHSSSSMGKNNSSDRNSKRDINNEKEANCGYSLIEGYQVSNKNSSSLKQQSDERKELNGSKNSPDDGHLHLFRFEDNLLSKVEELNRGVDQVEEYPLQTSYNVQTEIKGNYERELSPTKMVHSSAATKNRFLCSKDFKDRMLGSVPNSTLDATLKSNKDFVENLWISRFLRKDSALVVMPISCRLGIEVKNETQTNKSRDAGSRSQGNQINNDIGKAGHSFMSHIGDQKNATSKELPQETASPILSKLWRTSLFVKQLDDVEDIIPKKASAELPPCAPKTLNVFGKTDLNFQGSSVDYEIDKELIIDNDITQRRRLRQLIKFNGGKTTAVIQEESEIIKSQKAEYIVRKNSYICSVNEITNTVTPHFYPSDGHIDKCTLSEKPFALSLRERGARDNQLTPLCYSVIHEAVNEQTATFQAIRRLRLSRTDVVRLLKSPKAHITLKGFFLRLRLGKCVKGLGGTGYRVARIIGANCKKSISVDIDHLACIVDSRFVSNHDYLEDELKLWWSATLRSGEIPSKEELNRKIKERVKFGF